MTEEKKFEYRILKVKKITWWRKIRHLNVFGLMTDDFYMQIEHNGQRWWESIGSTGSGIYHTIEEQIQNAIYWHCYDKGNRSATMAKFLMEKVPSVIQK